jgi:hypothetical protein
MVDTLGHLVREMRVMGPQAIRPRLIPVFLAGVFATGALLAVSLESGSVPVSTVIPIAVLLTTAVLAIAFEHQTDPEASWISPNTTSALLYPLHFTVAIIGWLLGFDITRLATPTNAARALWLVTAGYVALSLGYFLTRWVLSRRPRRPAGLPDPRSISFFVIALLIADAAGKLTRVLAGAYFQFQLTDQTTLPPELWAIVIQASQLAFPAYVALRIASVEHPLARRWWSRAASIVWLVNVAYFLPTGRKESTIFLLLLPIITRVCIRSRFRESMTPMLGRALVGIAAVFALAPAYRAGMEVVNDKGALELNAYTIAEMMRTGKDADESRTATPQGVVETTLTRLSLVDPVYATAELVPNTQQLRGESLAWLFTGALVPRFIWPNKPDMELGNLFGAKFGFIDATDTRTSISVTYLGEFIWNYGPWGVLLMAGVGFINAALYTRLVPNRDIPSRAAYAMILLPLMYIGGTVALYYGGILRTIVVVFGLWIVSDYLAQITTTRRVT